MADDVRPPCLDTSARSDPERRPPGRLRATEPYPVTIDLPALTDHWHANVVVIR